ncbi:unnamed protein product, partial [Hapterophycus canaliculatus]
TGLERAVSLELYLNYDGDGGAPVSGDSNTMQCAKEVICSDATECGGETSAVEVLTFDGYGDGWSDPLGEATEYWTLTGATGQWFGNLMPGHEAARSKLCLPGGEYDFSAPGDVSW